MKDISTKLEVFFAKNKTLENTKKVLDKDFEKFNEKYNNCFDKEEKNTKNTKKKNALILSFSGGPDSVFAYHIFKYYKQKYNMHIDIYLAHFNHQIRDCADSDEQFCIDFAKENDVDIYTTKKDVQKLMESSCNDVSSLEAFSRDQRYIFLKEVHDNLESTGKYDHIFVATGANKDDNAESVFLHLARGCNLNGLCAMKFFSKSKNGLLLIRPLVNIQKKDVLEFLDTNNILYCVDKTNFENVYTRNIVRNVVFKTMDENGFDAVNIFDTLSKRANQYMQLLEKEFKNIDEKYILKKVEKKDCIVVYLDMQLAKLPQILFGDYMIYLFKKYNMQQDISQKNIEDMYALLQNGKRGKKIVPKKQIQMEIVGDLLDFSKVDNTLKEKYGKSKRGTKEFNTLILDQYLDSHVTLDAKGIENRGKNNKKGLNLFKCIAITFIKKCDKF